MPQPPRAGDLRYGPRVDLGYARVSTAKQDLDRQVDALQQAGIALERIYLDKKSGASTDRSGLRAALRYARDGDVLVVHTLDRLGRTVRDTLNLIHELAERGVGVRNLADPIRVDSANPADPMAQLAVVLLALFGQMRRTYMLERAAHARSVATAKGRRIGRPSVVDADKLAYAVHLRDSGHTLAEIVAKSGITRTTLYRHLPPRPAPLLTAAAPGGDDAASTGVWTKSAPPAPTPAPAAGVVRASVTGGGAEELLEAAEWPESYRPACPQCRQPTSGLREQYGRRAVVRHPIVVALAWPCGCAVDEHAAGLQAGAPAQEPAARTPTR